MNVGIWRTVLAAGERTLVWGTALLEAPALRAEDGLEVSLSFALEHGQMDWKPQIMWLTIPPLPLGQYRLTFGGVASNRSIKIIAPQPDRTITVAEPTGGDDMAAWLPTLAKPDQEIRLKPGRYRAASHVAMAQNTALVALVPGTVLLEHVSGHPYANKMFTPGEFSAFEGLTVESAIGGMFAHSYRQGEKRNMRVARCEFRGIGLGEWERQGLLVDQCVFEPGASAHQLTSHVLVRDCYFTGPTTHNLTCWGADSLAIIRPIMDGTDRGIVWQPYRRSVEFCLAYQALFRNISFVQNGGELLLVEGGPFPFEHNLIDMVRAYNCESSCIQFWRTTARNNVFSDFAIDGGTPGIWSFASETRNNTFRAMELRGGCVDLDTATDNVLERVFVVSPRTTRANQFQTPTASYKPRPAFAAKDGTSNTLRDCGGVDLGPAAARVGPFRVEGSFYIDGAISP